MYQLQINLPLDCGPANQKQLLPTDQTTQHLLNTSWNTFPETRLTSPSPDNCFVVNYRANLAAADISCRLRCRSCCLRARGTALSGAVTAIHGPRLQLLNPALHCDNRSPAVWCQQLLKRSKAVLFVVSFQRGTCAISCFLVFFPLFFSFYLFHWTSLYWRLCRTNVTSKSRNFHAETSKAYLFTNRQ